ncbi:hypothetical protein [Maritimibacter alkaliphilus]|uniref:hypothetical protein n=1 Tax=Maritimibacter alkaliphilus TaxID=404236 RepID=UPI001C98BB17|nr:hypothetical protein [Maritimibacter alkaliphilus]MBY6092505.1 hypothetical protein [Maritimibacter alkaliphilus]
MDPEMQARLPRIGLLLAAAMALGSCESPAVSQSNFETRYFAARGALEDGSYARASRAYSSLVPTSGPLAVRIKLELAHSELRRGAFAEAAAIAGEVAQATNGTSRSAALAVRGTALHELAVAQLSDGDAAAAKTSLQSAHAALDEQLKNDPDLDPLGAMAGRRAMIAARLARL